MSLVLQQRPAFKRAYKKLHPNQRDAVHAAMFAQRSARGGRQGQWFGHGRGSKLAVKVFLEAADLMHALVQDGYDADVTVG
ncbi:hypothetical protein SMCB_1347 [Serpentinimonas maccroryi]|uniref:Uncharacterized protein n=1 Tax=Serpentinimonas maccroryi TaxID=1458426 RepID=A0A060NQD3_9BURK|nr:hypothetical protein SMCB_1347 [Serpentinimonas maccroryi]